jgi:signal transduction histidine kinase
MRFFFLLIAFFSFYFSCSLKASSRVDSTITALEKIIDDVFKQTSPSNGLDPAFDKQLDSIFHFFDELSPAYKFMLLTAKAGIYHRTGNYDAYIPVQKKARIIAVELNDTSGIINANSNLNIAYFRKGILDSALYFLDENYFLIQQNQNIFFELQNLNAYSNHFRTQGELGKAKSYLKKMETIIFERNSRKEFLPIVYSNLALTFNVEEELDSALFYLDESLKYDPNNLSAKFTKASTLGKMKKYSESIEAYKGILNNELSQSAYAQAAANINLGQVYKDIGRFDLALETVLKGTQIAKELGFTEFYKNGLYTLRDIYEKKDDFKNALKYFELVTALNDSLNSKSVKESIANLESTYALKEKDSELSLVQAEKELGLQKLRERNYLLFGGSLLLLLITGFLGSTLRLVKKLKKTKTALELSNQTKDKFFSIIAHDLRSPLIGLQGVGQLINYYVDQKKYEKLVSLGDNIDNSVEKVNFLLNNLLNWAVLQKGSVPLKFEKISLKKLAQEVGELYHPLLKSKSLNLIIEGDDFQVTADYNTIALIFRNLLSNAIKFSENNSEIHIRIAQNKNEKYFEVVDFGKGIEPEKLNALNQNKSFTTVRQQGFGLGMQLIKEFTQLNKAVLTISSTVGAGTQIKIGFN